MYITLTKEPRKGNEEFIYVFAVLFSSFCSCSFALPVRCVNVWWGGGRGGRAILVWGMTLWRKQQQQQKRYIFDVSAAKQKKKWNNRRNIEQKYSRRNIQKKNPQRKKRKRWSKSTEKKHAQCEWQQFIYLNYTLLCESVRRINCGHYAHKI